MDRRKFLKAGAIAGVSATVSSSEVLASDTKNKAASILGKRGTGFARLGVIGVGMRGTEHLKMISRRDDAEVVAICDIAPDAIAAALNLVKSFGRNEPSVYTGSDFAYEQLLERDDIDGVIIATPWLWHARMSVSAMKTAFYLALG